MDVKIKICGLMSVEDVKLINDAKPDYAGFVFAPGRHRIEKDLAARMRNVLDETIPAVGVFVDEPIPHILQLVKENVIDMIQLHGRETPEEVVQIRKDLSDLSPETREVRIIKAIRMGTDDQESREETEKLLLAYKNAGADYFLFDSRQGGSGKTFDWKALPESPLPFFLAGGLHAENLADAIREVYPFAVDLSSGAETDGRKDPEKIRRIMKALL